MALTGAVAAAYSATGGAWEQGPGRIYDRLAEVLVAGSPVPLDGARVLDVGAGTGAATRAVIAAGARAVVAVDAAYGMLAHQAVERPPAAVGDLNALPFVDRAFDAAVAAFSLNHLAEPSVGLREMARVTRRGGPLLAASYGVDDAHPVKACVEAALAAHGWTPDPWYLTMRARATAALATVAHGRAAAAGAGLEASVEVIDVPVSGLDPRQLVAWRLGLAQHAPYVAGLPTAERRVLEADAVRRLGDRPPTLVRSVLVLRAISP
ncbi:MAG TPA: methyltransferase domain-containing protein [Acidimicrobiales bacterium]|nr:methyltransferase domain-containing protein [Acidimicrobiales bacterium]